MSMYETIYDFCKANRVEATMSPTGVYNCYINYTDSDTRPWGTGTNVLDAIDNGVVNYIRHHSQRGFHQPQKAQQSASPNYQPKDLINFFNFEGRIFWYWFARKYGKQNLINYYENEAKKANPDFLNQMKYLIEHAVKSIDDINTRLFNEFPAIHNIWIQSIVYYESFEREIYENNKKIMELIEKQKPEDRKAFQEIQKTIAKIDEEIQKIED